MEGMRKCVEQEVWKMTEIKKMDIKEFVEKGFLQEANRLFFHPIGMALEVEINDNGEYKFGGIWDYREDEEGILYGETDEDTKMNRIKKKDFVSKYSVEKCRKRKEKLGFVFQPLESFGSDIKEG